MTAYRLRPLQFPCFVAVLAAAPMAVPAPMGVPAFVGAQESEEEAVLAAVERLFEGMRTADSALVRSAFHPDAVLIGTEDREGNPATRVNPIDGFVRAVGGATGEWHEPFWDWELQIEENLASVWTRYAFYFNGEFSHCGVDAFLLARSEDGWKIVSLADTRQREGCPEPPPDAR